MLHLYGCAQSTQSARQSDAICTALQLINFWQDVAHRLAKGPHLPAAGRPGALRRDRSRHRARRAGAGLARADGFEVERARALMLAGAPLALRLPGRIGWELRLVVQGGLRILEAIEAADYDVFRRRPRLRKPDWLRLGWRALRMRIA